MSLKKDFHRPEISSDITKDSDVHKEALEFLNKIQNPHGNDDFEASDHQATLEANLDVETNFNEQDIENAAIILAELPLENEANFFDTSPHLRVLAEENANKEVNENLSAGNPGFIEQDDAESEMDEQDDIQTPPQSPTEVDRLPTPPPQSPTEVDRFPTVLPEIPTEGEFNDGENGLQGHENENFPSFTSQLRRPWQVSKCQEEYIMELRKSQFGSAFITSDGLHIPLNREPYAKYAQIDQRPPDYDKSVFMEYQQFPLRPGNEPSKKVIFSSDAGLATSDNDKEDTRKALLTVSTKPTIDAIGNAISKSLSKICKIENNQMYIGKQLEERLYNLESANQETQEKLNTLCAMVNENNKLQQQHHFDTVRSVLLGEEMVVNTAAIEEESCRFFDHVTKQFEDLKLGDFLAKSVTKDFEKNSVEKDNQNSVANQKTRADKDADKTMKEISARMSKNTKIMEHVAKVVLGMTTDVKHILNVQYFLKNIMQDILSHLYIKASMVFNLHVPFKSDEDIFRQLDSIEKFHSLAGLALSFKKPNNKNWINNALRFLCTSKYLYEHYFHVTMDPMNPQGSKKKKCSKNTIPLNNCLIIAIRSWASLGNDGDLSQAQLHSVSNL